MAENDTEKASEANYERPSSQVDLERRLENGNASFKVLSTAPTAQPVPDDDVRRDYAVEDNDLDGYTGAIDPEYQTYANETEKPYKAEEGPEAELEKQIAEGAYGDQSQLQQEAGAESTSVKKDDDSEDKEETKPATATTAKKAASSPTAKSSSSS